MPVIPPQAKDEMDTNNKPKSGEFATQSFTLKKRKRQRKYGCKLCTEVLDSVHQIEEGIFPENMKKAGVAPLYKSKDKQECSNYSPISLLITLSKILEKLVYKRVY